MLYNQLGTVSYVDCGWNGIQFALIVQTKCNTVLQTAGTCINTYMHRAIKQGCNVSCVNMISIKSIKKNIYKV